MDGLSSSFGDLLKTFRKRKRMTQQVFADRLGIHRNTIGIWERGDFLPESKTMVLETARQLGLDEQETRQLLEASLTGLMPHWYVPFLRNPFFTGRKEILDRLYNRLSPDQAPTRLCALHGLGGIGKTQVAVEYAYQYALAHSAVFWIEAESVEHIMRSFLAIAELLHLPEHQRADQQRIMATVQHWLTTHRRWLLIWDNVEDLELLQRYLPSAHQGAVLITTRRHALGTLAQGIELPTMTSEEGMLFLLRRAKVLNLEATNEQMRQLSRRMVGEYAAAQQLVTIMDGFPLALDQVGAYIEETLCSLTDYLELYQMRRAQLLERRGDAVVDHPASVATTWSLSFEKVERVDVQAAHLLRLCAFLSPDAIPEEIFKQGISLPGGMVAADRSQLHKAFGTLSAYSLLKRNIEEHTFSIHRLVQDVLREQISEPERVQWQQQVISLLNAVFPEVSYEVWEQCERLLPHVLACAGAIPDHVLDLELAEVLRKAADYLHHRAQDAQAEALYLRALSIMEQIVGSVHPQVASLLDGLANLYSYEQGKYEQAEPLFQRALYIREQTLGPEHQAVAVSLNNLGIHYLNQGKYEQAEGYYQRALRIWTQALGGDHPRVAYPLNNLGFLYLHQGKYKQAEECYQRALRIWTQALGDEHPLVGYIFNGLGALSCEQEKYERAEVFYQRALHLREQTLGAEHSEVASSLNGLAYLYLKQRKYKQAEPLYQRSLLIRKQRLGMCHPDTARSMAGLARLYGEQGNYEEADSLLQQACIIFEQSLGQAHPETMKARNDYCCLLEHRSRVTLSPGDESLQYIEPSQASAYHHNASPGISSEVVQTIHEQESNSRIVPWVQDQPARKPLSAAKLGETRQIIYTRNIAMREVTITCAICGRTVTQLHYPSGQIKFCSDACRAVRRVQMHEERVRKQREKRQAERKSLKQG